MDTHAPSPSPSSSHRSREAITEAVLRVLSTGGTDDLSVRKVAAEAGVSVGAVQHHFPTRAALIIGAMDAVTAHFRDRIGAALDSADSQVARLETFCEELAALGDAGRRDAVVWTAFAARAGTDGEIRAIHEREWTRTEEALRGLLTAAYPSARVTPDDAALLLAALDGIAVARGAEGDARMPAARGRALIAALLATFAART
ncbi:MAG: TetR family transcriptional regulator C-terminal domain-containing protein [Microbacterium enclense]